MTIKLKFRECRECKFARSILCLRCGAGEFFEVIDDFDGPTDEEIADAMREMDGYDD